MAGFWLTDNLYTVASLTDLNADPTDAFQGFETFFDDREFFKSLEIGWTTSRDRFYLDNVHVTFWHGDEIDETLTSDGWGLNFSASLWLRETVLPFLRAGYAEDGGSLLETSVSAGVGYMPVPGRDLLGAAVNWGDPNSDTFGSGLDDQFSAEVFYRYQLAENFQITPSVELLVDPALNPEESTLWLSGIRGLFTF
jgi:porin